MKILYFSRESEGIQYNHWYGLDAMKVVRQIPDVEIKFYGAGLERNYGDFIVTKYVLAG